MGLLRLLAFVLGSSLMIGESIRSYGRGRNPLFVLDDFFVGVPLVVVAVLMRSPTEVRRRALAASFAAAAGMLYGSFFSKIVDADRSFESNIDDGLLTILVGAALSASIVGLCGSLLSTPTPRRDSAVETS